MKLAWKPHVLQALLNLTADICCLKPFLNNPALLPTFTPLSFPERSCGKNTATSVPARAHSTSDVPVLPHGMVQHPTAILPLGPAAWPRPFTHVPILPMAHISDVPVSPPLLPVPPCYVRSSTSDILVARLVRPATQPCPFRHILPTVAPSHAATEPLEALSSTSSPPSRSRRRSYHLWQSIP